MKYGSIFPASVADSAFIKLHFLKILFHVAAPMKLRGSVVAVSPSLTGYALDHPLSSAWVREVPFGIVLWTLLGVHDKAIRLLRDHHAPLVPD